MRRQGYLFLFAALALTACEVTPNNPYDPSTPTAEAAKGTLWVRFNLGGQNLTGQVRIHATVRGATRDGQVKEWTPSDALRWEAGVAVLRFAELPPSNEEGYQLSVSAPSFEPLNGVPRFTLRSGERKVLSLALARCSGTVRGSVAHPSEQLTQIVVWPSMEGECGAIPTDAQRAVVRRGRFAVPTVAQPASGVLCVRALVDGHQHTAVAAPVNLCEGEFVLEPLQLTPTKLAVQIYNLDQHEAAQVSSRLVLLHLSLSAEDAALFRFGPQVQVAVDEIGARVEAPFVPWRAEALPQVGDTPYIGALPIHRCATAGELPTEQQLSELPTEPLEAGGDALLPYCLSTAGAGLKTVRVRFLVDGVTSEFTASVQLDTTPLNGSTLLLVGARRWAGVRYVDDKQVVVRVGLPNAVEEQGWRVRALLLPDAEACPLSEPPPDDPHWATELLESTTEFEITLGDPGDEPAVLVERLCVYLRDQVGNPTLLQASVAWLRAPLRLTISPAGLVDNGVSSWRATECATNELSCTQQGGAGGDAGGAGGDAGGAGGDGGAGGEGEVEEAPIWISGPLQFNVRVEPANYPVRQMTVNNMALLHQNGAIWEFPTLDVAQSEDLLSVSATDALGRVVTVDRRFTVVHHQPDLNSIHPLICPGIGGCTANTLSQRLGVPVEVLNQASDSRRACRIDTLCAGCVPEAQVINQRSVMRTDRPVTLQLTGLDEVAQRCARVDELGQQHTIEPCPGGLVQIPAYAGNLAQEIDLPSGVKRRQLNAKVTDLACQQGTTVRDELLVDHQPPAVRNDGQLRVDLACLRPAEYCPAAEGGSSVVFQEVGCDAARRSETKDIIAGGAPLLHHVSVSLKDGGNELLEQAVHARLLLLPVGEALPEADAQRAIPLCESSPAGRCIASRDCDCVSVEEAQMLHELSLTRACVWRNGGCAEEGVLASPCVNQAALLPVQVHLLLEDAVGYRALVPLSGQRPYRVPMGDEGTCRMPVDPEDPEAPQAHGAGVCAHQCEGGKPDANRPAQQLRITCEVQSQ